MTVQLLTEHHLEFLSLTGVCTSSSESIHVKMSHCWKSHVAAHICGYHTDIGVYCPNFGFQRTRAGSSEEPLYYQKKIL